MKAKRHILVANWKMNPLTIAEARSLWRTSVKYTSEADKVTTIICPPSVYLGRFPSQKSKRIGLGIQDVSSERSGAHTGMISALMAIDAGATHSLVGHSECRKRGDTDEIVNKKMHTALDVGLTAIVCIGEDVRNDNGTHLSFLRDQIENTFKGLSKKHIGHVIIAYEPVWAIGAPTAMEAHDVHEMSLFIRKTISELFKGIGLHSLPILYGGAVTTENAGDIVNIGHVDGLLVGRQSLEKDSLKQIIEILNS